MLTDRLILRSRPTAAVLPWFFVAIAFFYHGCSRSMGAADFPLPNHLEENSIPAPSCAAPYLGCLPTFPLPLSSGAIARGVPFSRVRVILKCFLLIDPMQARSLDCPAWTFLPDSSPPKITVGHADLCSLTRDLTLLLTPLSYRMCNETWKEKNVAAEIGAKQRFRIWRGRNTHRSSRW